MGLRARKKQATSIALQRSAIDLFLQRGYEETTVQDITDAAGVSQRTFFRYYPTKDAVLLTEHARREEELTSLLAGRPDDEPIADLAAAVVELLARDVAERLELVRVQTRVNFTVPALADRFSGHHDRLAVLVAEHVAGRLGVDDRVDPRPRLVGNQVIRAWTTAVLIWLTAGAEGDLVGLATEALRTARTDPALVDQPA